MLQLSRFSSLLAGIDFFVTIFKRRASGMDFRLPIFIRTSFCMVILMMISVPILIVALTLLALDRYLANLLAALLTPFTFGAVLLKLSQLQRPCRYNCDNCNFSGYLEKVVFLHMFRKSTPFWNTIAFAFTVLVIILLIGGSLFSMVSANYNMMPQSMRLLQL